MSRAIWTPSPERAARANLTRFLGEVAKERPEVTGYPALYRFSVDHAGEFWRHVWDFCDVRAERRGHRCDQNDGSRDVPHVVCASCPLRGQEAHHRVASPKRDSTAVPSTW